MASRPKPFTLFGIGAAVGLAAGVAGTLLLPMLFDAAFLRVFFTSAGFGGLAALVAALIAFAAARASIINARELAERDREQAEKERDRNERRDRKAQWWSRAEWALNQVVSNDEYARVIGLGVLESLGQSEWADEHEADIIAAATDYALDVVEVDAGDEPIDSSTAEPEQGTMDEGGGDDG